MSVYARGRERARGTECGRRDLIVESGEGAGVGGTRRDEAGESEGGISTERPLKISGLIHGAS